MRDQRRLVAIGLAAIVELATACGGASHVSAPSRSPSIARTGAQTKTTPSVTVPNPFTIVARFSASSLGLKNPIDLAIGPDGNLYVTDIAPSVTVISPEGKVIRRWGKRGTRPGDFSFVGNTDPTAIDAWIAVGPDGKVYVSDSGNHRIDVFSPSGAFIRQFGSFGGGKGQLLAPFELAVDAEGDVYVADDQELTLSKFSPTGHFEWSIGGASATDPNLRGRFQLANVDSHGRVVAAVDPPAPQPTGSGWIVYIDARGHKVDAFGTGSYLPVVDGAQVTPCQVTVNSTGYTVVASCPLPSGPSDTFVFDRTHRLVGAWYLSPFDRDVIPRFGPHGEVFAMADDGSILKLKVALPGA